MVLLRDLPRGCAECEAVKVVDFSDSWRSLSDRLYWLDGATGEGNNKNDILQKTHSWFRFSLIEAARKLAVSAMAADSVCCSLPVHSQT